MKIATDSYRADDRNEHPHILLRHCVASGLLARRTGSCACAACIGTYREAWQSIYGDNTWDENEIATRGNFMGLKCAGCTGTDADKTPGHWVDFGVSAGVGAPPGVYMTDLASYDSIVKCCKEAVKNRKR